MKMISKIFRVSIVLKTLYLLGRNQAYNKTSCVIRGQC